jgi:hypothetical protein
MRITLCAALLLISGIPTVGLAQTPAAVENTIQLTAGERPLRDALSLVFTKANVPYIIGNGVEGNVYTRFDAMPFESLLSLLCQSASPALEYTKTKDGIYIVRVKEKTAPAPIVNIAPAQVTVQNQMPKTPISVTTFSGTTEEAMLASIEMQMMALDIERKALEAEFAPGSMNPAFVRIDKQLHALL